MASRRRSVGAVVPESKSKQASQQRRRSESGSVELLEIRRLQKIQQAKNEDSSSEIDDSETKLSEETTSADDDDFDDAIEQAIEAAVVAGLLQPPNQISALSSQIKKKKGPQRLNSGMESSPYLNLNEKGAEICAGATLKPGKGSCINIENLVDRSEAALLGSRAVHHPEEKKKHVRKLVTSGRGWFNLTATEMTEEVQQDLRALRMRSALDPKRFYKSHDRPSKFVQVGTVIEGRHEFYSSRLTKKERRTNLVEELMADEKSRQYTKRKFSAIQSEKQKKQRFGPKRKVRHQTKHSDKKSRSSRGENDDK
jgi:hypothetical protein